MGFYSSNLSKKNIITYAFEPVSENYQQLKSNKKINDLNNLKIYNYALSNEEKEADMWVPDITKTGGFSIYDKEDEEISNYNPKRISKVKIKTVTADNIINLQKKNIAIKIDVERHEFKVLEGMTALLKNNKIILQVEIFERRKKKIISYLKEKNFILLNVINKDYYFKNF